VALSTLTPVGGLLEFSKTFWNLFKVGKKYKINQIVLADSSKF
jgi:hypothetical protein